jgi:UDPglucose 6-dehydrogenase
MKLLFIGTGYVGLVSGACLAKIGHEAVCLDVDGARIAGLKNGVMPIYEPGLEEVVAESVASGRLSFSTSPAEVVPSAEVIFIAVGTPSDQDGSADLSCVLRAAADIAPHLDGYKVLVNKSTVPVGTAELVRREVASRTGQPFDVVSNPEFLKEGEAILDFLEPNRIVVGADSERAGEVMRAVYAPLVASGTKLLLMDVRSAEMTKYASNAMLATKISFINEIANICEAVGADVDRVRLGMGYDHRIGFEFLRPGVGYGGSCFPKDVRALARMAHEGGLRPRLLESVEAVNELQKQVLAEKVLTHFRSHASGNGSEAPLRGRTLGVWGLAFKPSTDDIREASSLVIIERLLREGALIRAYDPAAAGHVRRVLGERIELVSDRYEALDGADALLVVTEWNEFRDLDLQRARSVMRAPVIFDGRNLYDPDVLVAGGFVYYGVGRAVARGETQAAPPTLQDQVWADWAATVPLGLTAQLAATSSFEEGRS